MARDIKGGTFQKQRKNIFHLMAAFGVGRHENPDHKTHSDGLAKKRDMILDDLVLFANDHTSVKKLNRLFNPNDLTAFLGDRLEGLKTSTSENYIRTLSSLAQGLKEEGIAIEVDRSFFDAQVAKLDMSELQNFVTGRAIKDSAKATAIMHEDKYVYGLLSELSLETGFRISEVFEVVRNIDKYLTDCTLLNVVGKGNHLYIPKKISWTLAKKLQLFVKSPLFKLPHQNTFRAHLRMHLGIVPHDFRYTFANDLYFKLLKQGVAKKEVLQRVSVELNHHREEITVEYKKRA